MDKLTVIDIFCGAGGFSEGFRQQGFEIIGGIDYWEPAIKTFNHNFGLDCLIKNVLDFENSVDEIESLPDTDVIIGSPPCVTFSSSNISGKADKTSGITLTQIFLRIVAVKKWKSHSKLKAWYMENVPSSIKHLGNEYTFEELGLGDWATKNKIGRSKVAIKLGGNQQIVNSADFGSAQNRERVIAGEVIKKKRLIIPKQTHFDKPANKKMKQWVTLKEIKGRLPKPYCSKNNRLITDPNYPTLTISLDKLTDQFYDTGLFECEWKQSKFLKTNHPYMGKMAFPENERKPSRTITATKIGTSREAIAYLSEYNRNGDGEYRTPTVREAACLMSFPITYQFLGGETTKWRLVGNAVCPSVARAFAKQLRYELKLPILRKPIVEQEPTIKGISDLNTFSAKIFGEPPRRNQGSRFRRHPLKDGNITVTLSNYDIDKNEKKISKWITSVQYGNGKGFPTFNFPDGFYEEIEILIRNAYQGDKFLNIINNGFSEKIARGHILQDMYERQRPMNNLLEPTNLIEEVAEIITRLDVGKDMFNQNDHVIFKNKEVVPISQLFALYAINKVATSANYE